MHKNKYNSQEHGLKLEHKEPWDVNPFDVCKAFSKRKIIEYTIEGTTMLEAKKNLLEYFYKIEEEHVKLTNHKGLITNKPIEIGHTHNDKGEITGCYIKGEFHCYIPEKLKPENKDYEEIR